MPEFGRDPSGVAGMGTAVHKHIEHMISDLVAFGSVAQSTTKECTDTLDERGINIADFCLQEVTATVEAHGGFTDEIEVYTELPLEWRGKPDADGNVLALTGHPDLVIVCADGTVHVWDWKCGFAAVKVATENPQLMCYAVLLSQDQAFTDAIEEAGGLTVHLISVGNEWGDVVTSAHYAVDALGKALDYLGSIAEATRDKDAPRTPHPDACRYCRARGTSRCPESVAAIEAVGAGVEKITDPATGFIVATQAATGEVAALWDSCKVAEAAIENFKSMIRHHIESVGPQSIEGLKLTNGFEQLIPAPTADVVRAFSRMLDADSVIECSSVSVGKLAEKLKIEKSMTGKAAKEAAQRVLIAGGAASTIRRSGRILRTKTKPKRENKSD
jgi:hypothetical protein